MKIGQLIPTLTGYEEIGIEQVCGKSLEELIDTGTEEHPRVGRDILLGRAMGAVLIARDQEIPLKAAWVKVLAMPQRDLGGLFEDEDEDDVDEVLDDEPTTDAGKGGSVSESEPTS